MAFKKRRQIRVEMVRPVIPHDIDFRSLAIDAGNRFQTLTQPWDGDAAEIEGHDLSLDGIEKSYYSHTSIRTMAISHFGLPSAHEGPKPSLAWLPIEADLVLEQDHNLSRFRSGLLESLLDDFFFFSYRGSGL